MEEIRLKALLAKRGQLKAQLTRFKNYLNEFDASKSIFELTKRLEKTELLWSEFGECQSQIEILDETEAQLEYRVEFENNYYETVSKAEQYVSNTQSPQERRSSANSSAAGFHILNNIKLPTLQLISFGGLYTEFTQFIDNFNALVHNNPSLTNVQRFFYLKSCLKDEPLQVISSLEVTDGNYNIALNLLKERYENKRVIINNHLKLIFELPHLQRESATALRKLLDDFLKHIRALKTLDEPTDTWNSILVYLLSNKLDIATKKAWEISVGSNELPSVETLTKFLAQRCQVLETLTGNQQGVSSDNYKYNSKWQSDRKQTKTVSYVSTIKPRCQFCNDLHFIYRCPKLQNLSPLSRLEEIRKLKLCTNCLRSNHTRRDCRSSGCKKCNQRHNTMLHLEEVPISNTRDTNVSCAREDSNDKTNTVTNETTVMCSPSTTTHSDIDTVLLSTAIIYIADVNNKPVKCRALLDSASMSNFMSKSLSDKLNLPVQKIDMPICGINNSLSSTSERVRTKIQSLCNSYNVELSFFILEDITGRIPARTIPKSQINIPSNINLADYEFNKSQQIDILIGAQIYYDLLCVGQIKSGPNQPIYQKSKFGWLVSGPLTFERPPAQQTCLLSSSNSVLEKQMEQFWKLEEIGFKRNSLTNEEKACEEHFVNNVERDSTGRFTVGLPLKPEYKQLGDTQAIATRNFLSLERRLSKNEYLRNEYAKFINEYIALGHMSQINLNEEPLGNIMYYLPHHAVEKPSSVTTKLRVVFNASQISSSGKSLNDVLLVGPNIQDDLVSILLRFRLHNYVIKADIAKMYRQIMVKQCQRDLQRILWRNDSNAEINHYRLNTVTYGTASASFLATRCLRQIAIENRTSNFNVSEVITNDFYMDDLITGCSTIEDAKTLKGDLQDILQAYGFELRQWMTNEPSILGDDIGNSDRSHFHVTDDKTSKTLGVLWDSESDGLRYAVDDPLELDKVTKRTILSVISKIFDPLGLIGPVVVKAKVILQRLWKLKLDWDESIPQDLHTAWKEFLCQLPALNRITFSRQIVIPNYIELQLHGFADASIYAYGACIYLRTTDTHENNYVHLVTSKSRVAPLKPLTLPRLELHAALLLSQLFAKVVSVLKVKIERSYLWSDSRIALSWIASEPATLKTFVCNRVAEIQELTSCCSWQHVCSEDNPADIVSRGCDPERLASHELWRHGPIWLHEPMQNWPVTYKLEPEDVPERKKESIGCLTASTETDSDILSKYSSYSRLRYVMAYVLRFIQNLRKVPHDRLKSALSLAEIDHATITLTRLAQTEPFEKEIASLRESGRVSPSSKLASLNPFLDDAGIIRVGGRLRNSPYQYTKKHPAVLPSKSHFTNLIINYEHKRLLHAGCQTVLSSVRNTFWPLNGKSIVRRELRKCVSCFRNNPRPLVPLMGDLPAARVNPRRPFSATGVDFAGPFPLKDGKTRNRKIVKSYICIFICFCTKAVHLELVGDLSKESFLNTLKRFIARRGSPSELYSDNATNFTGAHNELRRMATNETLKRFLLDNEIIWHFIPPKSPHFGGLWERNIRSIKHHLKRIIGGVHFTYEVFYTVLTQVESILNSRPLCPLSDDPNDFEPLTPGHFLIGSVLTTFPQEEISNTAASRASDYKHAQLLLRHFWHRWSNEYIHNLQQRSKWRFPKPIQLKIGHLVMIKEDNIPPLQWSLGRILEVFPGPDGVVRVANVNTKNGVLKRSVSKLCVLPVDIEDNRSSVEDR